MNLNLLLLASHAVAEFDDLRMFTDLGYDCFAPGGFEVPGAAGEGIRPPLPEAPSHPDLVARLQEVRAERGEPGPAIDWGKARLHDDIIDWADAIIVHHFPEQWIVGQWDRIRHKRVIWRTCGQSDARLELVMEPLHRQGLQIVRYSPAEQRYFESVGHFAGQDALIRFGKYPADYGPWTGNWVLEPKGQLTDGQPFVTNVTQDMIARGDACGLSFWRAATEGLPVCPMGKGSKELGGLGEVPYDHMVRVLAGARAYCYVGTTPASYTLALIEAMLSGVPVISIGPSAWSGPDALFEGGELVAFNHPTQGYVNDGYNKPAAARDALGLLLDEPELARFVSSQQRQRAIDLFDVAKVGPQWQAFLS